MRFVLFVHSLRSCWNHGNAHFLRGVVGNLQRRGHDVVVYEARDAWSASQLVADQGAAALGAFTSAYPTLSPIVYDTPELERMLDGADIVIVHEWTDPALVRAIGLARKSGGKFKLLFHDTHHRAVTDAPALQALNLCDYDGVLAFGQILRDVYLRRGWAQRAWTWHEAADTTVFFPREEEREGDLVWIGNYGDGERGAELEEFIFTPARQLRLKGAVYGVRYPEAACHAVEQAGLSYRGWLPSHRVPSTFARYAFTVHVPRRPYTRILPGIPTIRPFEALACGIPLISAPWEDCEGLFLAGLHYLRAQDGEEMRSHMQALLHDPEFARALAMRGREHVLQNHTCAHRVDQLLAIISELSPSARMVS